MNETTNEVELTFTVKVSVPASEAQRGQCHVAHQIEKMIEINSGGWTADVDYSEA